MADRSGDRTNSQDGSASTSRDTSSFSASQGTSASTSTSVMLPSPTKAARSAALLPDPSLPAPPLADSEEGFTADQLIQRQAELEEQAREAVPFSYTRGGCTYEKGYIRQPVYACRTCGGGGVCAGCSVGCHAEHDLVELFAKRHFRCDCGTLSLCRGKAEHEAKLKPCNLRGKELSYAPENDENTYSKNFEGEFCRCARGKHYDAETEEETMMQCLVCEDWIHESCSSLRPSRLVDDVDAPDRDLADGPLIDHDAFDLFICNECVRRPDNKTLRHYIGSKGWITCLPDDERIALPAKIDGIEPIEVTARGSGWSSKWKVYGLEGGTTGDATIVGDTTASAEEKPADDAVAAVLKRKAEDATNDEAAVAASTTDNVEPAIKRQKTSNGLTVVDDFDDVEGESSTQLGQDTPAVVDTKDSTQEKAIKCSFPGRPLFARAEQEAFQPRLDIFLTTRFRERICRCPGCTTDFDRFPYVADAEETYSPPCSETSSQAAVRVNGQTAMAAAGDASSDAGRSQTSSTYDLGLAALNRLPRERMMESLEAYNRMRDALFAHLRPFADQGKVVDAESVREFFRQQREQQQRR